MSYQNERLNSDRLEMMKKEINFEGVSVLDIGCAEGYFCREVMKLGAGPVMGVCDNLKSEAIRLANAEHLTNIKFIQSDFRNVEYPKSPFDCVLFLSVLHYFHTPQEKIGVLIKISQLTARYGFAFFEFEEGLNHPGHCSFGEFCELVIRPEIGFKTIKLLGFADKNNRKVILCKK